MRIADSVGATHAAVRAVSEVLTSSPFALEGRGRGEGGMIQGWGGEHQGVWGNPGEFPQEGQGPTMS